MPPSREGLILTSGGARIVRIAGPTIADWIALNTVRSRYCCMLDGTDWASLFALCADDDELDIGDGDGSSPVRGRETAWTMVRGSIGDAVAVNQVHSPEIEVDGDAAGVVWAMQDRVLGNGDRSSLTGYGRYHERRVRRDGDWRLASLRLKRLHLSFTLAVPR